mmetsp:Transcript_27068/g.31226  ORF Transcript_27068/g.31226 Transcript_27068/m.31226 type:complete len:115 (+) Transcript_27068:762-1106(+)
MYPSLSFTHINIGMKNVLQLCNLIIEAKSSGLDIGSTLLLENFNRQASEHNGAISQILQGLRYSYNSNDLPSVLARSILVGGLDQSRLLKESLLKLVIGNSEIPEHMKRNFKFA